MHMINKYIEYIKNNPEGYWFKRKLYGWGWTPATWQGWAIILAFAAFIIWSGLDMESAGEPTEKMAYWFAFKVIISVILLIWICYKKGEKPRWQWGLPKDNTPE